MAGNLTVEFNCCQLIYDGPVRLRRNVAFRRFWVASTVSGLGSAVTAVALGVLIVTDLGGTASDVGFVAAAGVAPYLVVGLFAGVLADRVRRRPLLVGTDLGRAVVLTGVPVLAALGWLDVWVLAALMVVFGTLSTMNMAGQQSFLPRLVPRAQLHRANTRLEQSGAVAQTTGPLLAGGLVAAVGAPLAIVADAVSFAVSGLLVAAAPGSDPRPPRESASVLTSLREGLRWVYRHDTLRPFALSTHGWFLFHAVVTTAYVPYALRTLTLTPLELGTTFALAGIGALLGSSCSEAVTRRIGVPAAVAGSRALEATGWGVVALAGGAPLAGFGQFLYGLGLGTEGPVEMAYRQGATPDHLQGRMNATMRSINRAAVVVGAPAGGLFADAVGLRPALWVGAAGIGAAGLGLAFSGFRRARY